MGEYKRFAIFWNRYFGLGISWDNFIFPLHLSFSFPFFSITVGFGKRKK